MTIHGADGGTAGVPGRFAGVEYIPAPEVKCPESSRPSGNFDPSMVFELLTSPQAPNSQLPAPQVPSNPDGVIAGATSNLLNMGTMEAGGDIYALMALLHETAQKQRTAARELRSAEMQQQVTDLLGAAQSIRDSARERMVGAIVAGSMQIVGGAFQFVAGARTAYGAYKGAIPENAQVYSDFARATDSMFRGVGDTARAGKDVQAADFDAQKAEREAAAHIHDNSAQQAQDQAQLMMDIMRDIRDKLSAMEQSRLETNRGITRNL